MERRRKHQMWFDLVMAALCMVGIGVIAYISHRMYTSSPLSTMRITNETELSNY